MGKRLTYISPAQCRAARALLDWSREQLAEKSGVPIRTLNDFETGATAPRAATLDKLHASFGRAGIAFVDAHNDVGGVILLQRPLHSDDSS
jgi:transcriptional regulator with XRE-family HTH domain